MHTPVILELNLRPLGKHRTLPINYQYEFSSWIYRLLHQGSPEFAQWLHETGYSTESDSRRRFKLFSFSHLQFAHRRDRDIQGDRLTLTGESCRMRFATAVPQSMNHLLAGVFADRRFSIGDRKSQADLEVASVRVVPLPDLKAPVRFRAKSPISITVSSSDSTKRYDNLAPNDPRFSEQLRQNLERKWAIVSDITEIEPDPEPADWHYRLLSDRPRSRLITIKAGKIQQTRVRGYEFDFELSAPRHLLQTALLCGVGEGNSQGFGSVAVVEPRKKQKV